MIWTVAPVHFLSLKSLNGLAPSYIIDSPTPDSPAPPLRSADQLLLSVPRASLVIEGSGAFAVRIHICGITFH